MDREERMEMLLNELHTCQWDVVCITETWRKQAIEKLKLSSGHMWCGGGGSKGTRGTGFIVHRKWSVRQHKVVSERLSYVDIVSNMSTETSLGGFLFDLIDFGPKLVWVDFCLI